MIHHFQCPKPVNYNSKEACFVKMAYSSMDCTRELTGGEMFICTECGEGFRLYQKLIEHMAIHGLFFPDALSINAGISNNTHIEFALHENGTLTVVDQSVLSNFTFLFGKPSSKLSCCQDPTKTPNQTALISSKMAESECAQFKCERCGQLFRSLKSLQLHQQYRVLEQGFKCTLCCKMFNDRESLQSHLQNHAHERFYSCGHCGKRFLRQETLLTHQKQWHGSSSSKALVRLQEDQENSMKRSYPCKICGLRFFWLSDLQSHQSGHSRVNRPPGHATQQQEMREDQERKANAMSQFNNNHTPLYSVENEDSTMSPDYNGKMHQLATRNQMQRANLGMPRMRGRRRRNGISHGKLYSCKHCHRVFLHSSSLSRHMRYHKGTMHACVHCGRRFPQKCNVTKHVALYHSSTQPTANGSSKTTESSEQGCVKASTETTGDKGNEQEEILHSSNVDDEMSLDSQKPKPKMKYKCKECCIVFQLFSVYKRHLSYHKRDPSKKLISCPYCPSRFSFRSALSRHIKSHEESFKKNGTKLANSNVVDPSKRLFLCPYCPSRFSFRSALVCHIHSHEEGFKKDETKLANSNVDDPKNQHKDIDTGEPNTNANDSVPSKVLYESNECSQT